MNKVYLSICLDPLQFPSALFHNFPFTSLDRFIPRYFILFWCNGEWNFFLVSISDSSLLVYRNETFLYINFLGSNFIKYIEL